MGGKYFIGIGGGTCAGKTTLADYIKKRAEDRVTIISQDNYYEDQSHLTEKERAEQNYDHPDAFDWKLMYDQITSMMNGETVEMPKYSFEDHNRMDDTEKVNPNGSIILEGILALHNEDIRELMDLSVYVYADPDRRVLRRVERDIKERGRSLNSVMRQYLDTVKPMHERYVEPTRKYADLEIPGRSWDQEYTEKLNEIVENIFENSD